MWPRFFLKMPPGSRWTKVRETDQADGIFMPKKEVLKIARNLFPSPVSYFVNFIFIRSLKVESSGQSFATSFNENDIIICE